MNNKWWEYYAVRYFVGTIIGATLVTLLNHEPSSPFEGCLSVLGVAKESTALSAGLVAALGFAFCYLASSPVLTLHATRAHLRLSAFKASPWKYFIALPASTIVSVVWFCGFLPLGVAVISGLVMGIQIGLAICSLLTRFYEVENFYRELATTRAKSSPRQDGPPTAGMEYITSYRHLREHGNAFLIVLLEGLLAYQLIHSPSRSHAFLVLALWLIPASATWLLGTILENRLVVKPLA